MGKMFTLLFTILLALGSIAGYLFLNKEIIAGNLKIAVGQKQLAEGEQLLARGKAKLASGRQRLSRAKDSYGKLKTMPDFFVAALPVVGPVMIVTSNRIAGQKIAEGDRLVAQGAGKVRAGEAQLAEGRLQLQRGEKRLRLTDKIYWACGIGAIFFTLLSVALVFCWRQSLIKFLKRTKT